MSEEKFLAPYKPEHPVFDFPKGADAERFLERFGVEGWNAMMNARNERIEGEESDPFNYRVEMPVWHLADFILGLINWNDFKANRKPNGMPWELPIPEEWLCESIRKEFDGAPADILYLSGGNRSTKTTYVLDRAFRAIKKHPRSRIWMFHETAKMSAEYHQIPLYYLMPKNDRATGKGQVGYVAFKEATGFSDGKFRLKNGSAAEFHSYQEDLTFAEGGELGAASRERSIGYVADEKCPLFLLEKLRARCATRSAIGLHPYTPIDGYTAIVKWFRGGAKTVLSGTAKHLEKPRELPIVEVKTARAEGLKDFKIATIFFWSEWNPYGNFENLLRSHAMENDEQKLIKFYGYTETLATGIFPRFSRSVHVFKPSELPKDGTRYMYIDPTGVGRNWFMIWILVDINGRIWVYREFPDTNSAVGRFGYPGPWAVTGESKTHKFGGLPGEGQKALGLSIEDYKEYVARVENWRDAARSSTQIEEWDEANGADEKIFRRRIDSRFANNAQYQSQGKKMTLLEACREIKLYFDPASGANIDEGVSIINSLLAYTARTDGKPAELPKLMICENCHNMIFALENWTGMGGQSEATKDPIDTLRYMAMDAPSYIDPDLKNTGPYGGRGRREEFNGLPTKMTDFFD